MHQASSCASADSPPLILWVAALISLPYVRDAHVRVEPVNLACLQMAEPQAKTRNTPHFVDVHNLLNDPLKIKGLKYVKS